MFKRKQLMWLAFVLLTSMIVTIPIHALLDVSDSYQVECEFKSLMNAINKTIDEMKLTIVDQNISGDNAHYSLDQGMKWSDNSNPIYYKVTVFMENEVFNLRVSVGTYKYSIFQKRLNSKYLNLFIENVKKYLTQEVETEQTKEKEKIQNKDRHEKKCPACKELIALDAILCKYCKSYIGEIKNPSNLRVSNIQMTHTELYWKDESCNEDGFYIERKTANEEYIKIASVKSNTEYYRDETVLSKQIYHYRIKAFNIEYESDYSNEVSVTVQ